MFSGVRGIYKLDQEKDGDKIGGGGEKEKKKKTSIRAVIHLTCHRVIYNRNNSIYSVSFSSTLLGIFNLYFFIHIM